MKIRQKKAQTPKPSQYAFITGASSGIGTAAARLLAEAGFSLVLSARRLDNLKKLRVECLKLGAPDVLIYKLDVRIKKDVENCVSKLKSKKLAVKVLINNAGLAKGVDLFQNSSMDDADVMLDTNVKGLLYVTRALLPGLIETQGHIINMGSVAGRLVYEGGSVYCATKFAVRAVNDALRLDLKGTGVRVSNIEPGMVHTDFSKVRLGNQQKADAVYADMMPLTANDIAETILWCLQRPAHVNVSELVIYPTDQASVGHVVRGDKSVARFLKK